MLKVEIDDQNFLEFDFDDVAYIVGHNSRNLWKVYRSMFYYFNKSPQLSTNVYGDDNIELTFNDESVSIRNTNAIFINSRNSIYEQMIYKKGSLLYDQLNDFADDFEINKVLEAMNDNLIKLGLCIQDKVTNFSNNLFSDFEDITYQSLLKQNLALNYAEQGSNYPLEYMDTEVLLDELVSLIELLLKRSDKPTWIVLYNPNSFISDKGKKLLFDKLNKFRKLYDLKVIYISQNISNCSMSVAEIENVVLATNEFHQLLPIEEFKQSIKLRYPNSYPVTDDTLLNSLIRIIPSIGSKEVVYFAPKDLVLLKIVNDILGYETSINFDNQILTSAETQFLKN